MLATRLPASQSWLRDSCEINRTGSKGICTLAGERLRNAFLYKEIERCRARQVHSRAAERCAHPEAVGGNTCGNHVIDCANRQARRKRAPEDHVVTCGVAVRLGVN